MSDATFPPGDPFLARLGEIAVAFSWLESLIEEFVHEFCGTKKVEVFTRRMNFQAKCDKLDDLVQLQGEVRGTLTNLSSPADDYPVRAGRDPADSPRA